jgi:hypothetical protein
MLVRLLVPRATIAGPQQIGDEIEVTADEAERMVAAEQAVPVREAKIERAVPSKARVEKAKR